MCTNDIISKLNHWDISPNHYQIEKNRRVLVRKHFEKLSELFAGNVNVKFEVDRNPSNFLADAAVEVDLQSVDLKGLKKLMELCSFLRKNVDELKYVFEKRRRSSSGYYTESELADLEPELRSLDEDVHRMMDTLSGITGNRQEIKHVLEMYTANENRYVRLRSLKKSIKLRYQEGKTKNDTNDNKFNLGACDVICALVRSVLFNTAQEKNAKCK